MNRETPMLIALSIIAGLLLFSGIARSQTVTCIDMGNGIVRCFGTGGSTTCIDLGGGIIRCQ